MKMPFLNKDYMSVLEQIAEDGRDDLDTLEETLRYDRGKLKHIIKGLQHKGLVSVKYVSGYEVWVSLSTKGRRLIRNMWPESMLPFGY